MARKFTAAPPVVSNTLITFPKPHVLLITLNRPTQLNAIPNQQHFELDALYCWYDAEPSLRCAVLTGTGRGFCAGADLREYYDARASGAAVDDVKKWLTSGFGGLSNRRGKKPVIAAVNGVCLGGGMEMAVNADIVLAARGAKFGLPEVTVGVVAVAGALPRLIRTVGRQRASEMALVGQHFSAEEMAAWGLVNKVVDHDQLLTEALRLAEVIASNSPDAIIVTRAGIVSGWDGVGPEEATRSVEDGLYRKMEGRENMLEGVASFVERRKPRWKDSKL